MRPRRNSAFSFVSFIDILFSFLGVVIFIIGLQALLVSAGEGRDTDSFARTHTRRTIFSARKQRRDEAASPQWLHPILLLLQNNRIIVRYEHTLEFADNQALFAFLEHVAKTNCVYGAQNKPVRYSLILGISAREYSRAKEIIYFLYSLDKRMRAAYPGHYYPLHAAKIPIMSENIRLFEQLWQETEIPARD